MKEFYYTQLECDEQRYYDEILYGLRNNWHAITLYGLKNEDVLMKCIEAVKYDCVEYFYVNFKCVTWRKCNDYIEYIPEYIFEGEEKEKKIKDVGNVISGIIDSMPNHTQMTVYGKCLWLHNYIVRHCEYNYEAIKIGMDIKNAYSIEGVFLERKAVCQGIAMAYRCLCRKIGIESIVVRGNSLKPGDKNYERHAWNIVKVGEAAIHVDATWDMCLTKNKEPIRYDYFFLPDIEMMRDHQYVKYPICRNREISMFHYAHTFFGSIEELKDYIDTEENVINKKKEFFLHFKMKNRKESRNEVSSILSDYIMSKVNKSFVYSYSINEAQSVFMFHFVYK